jgi:hypothetical protein
MEAVARRAWEASPNLPPPDLPTGNQIRPISTRIWPPGVDKRPSATTKQAERTATIERREKEVAKEQRDGPATVLLAAHLTTGRQLR